MSSSVIDDSIFRSLAESGPDPVAIRTDGALSYVNPAMARYLEYEDSDDIVRLTAQDFVARHVRPPSRFPLGDLGADSSGEVELTTCRGRVVSAEYRI